MSQLRILFLSAEAEPFTRVGNLAEMAGLLPQALRLLSKEEGGAAEPIDIRLVIPFHGHIRRTVREIHRVVGFFIQHSSGPIPVEVYTTVYNQVPVYFISGDPIGQDSPVYSHDQGFDANKYIFFSLAAMELCRQLDWKPDIVHTNDWHTAPAVYWLSKNRESGSFFEHTRSLLTIHNLSYLGVGANFAMYAFGLAPSEDPILPDWSKQLPLPLGILHADWLTTCSPGYTAEIQQRDSSSGLENLIALRADQISGILHGLDENRWDPSNDPYLPVSFTSESLGVREANKIALLSQLGLLTKPRENSMQNTLMIGLVGPLEYQKGIDLAIETLYQMASQQNARFPCDWRAVIIGSGLTELESSARALEEKNPDLVRFVRRFETPLVHHAYGALDVLLIPARQATYDPNAMIGLRYGSIPVAHATGSLQDIILHEQTGLLFSKLTPDGIEKALRRAARLFSNPATWLEFQVRAMQQDFSWRRTAREYYSLYKNLQSSPIVNQSD